jgi:peptide/nickel transport system substrate-binding protein
MSKLMRSVQLTIALVLILSMGTMAVNAQEEVAREDTVIFDIDGKEIRNPDVFNPFVHAAFKNEGQHQAMWEPLFILNYETGEIMPWLGLSMESNETLDVWTLNIRPGVKWADGEDFNADDVVFTTELQMEYGGELSNYSAEVANWVESVEKIDDLTVQFNLKAPNPRFQLDHYSVRIWGSVIIVPEHVFADQDPLTFKFSDPEQGQPFGTGPYLNVGWSETEFVWDRNDDYWGVDVFGLPAPKRLIWRIGATEEIRVAAAAVNEYDSLCDITLGAFEALKAQNPNWIAWLPESPYVWLDPCSRNLMFNTTVEPWDDPEMRWAINFAVNRAEIIEFAYEGSTIPSRSMFVEYGGLKPYIEAIMTLYDEYPMLEYNPDKTVEILESKGYTKNADGYYEKDGEVLSLAIACHEGFIEKRRMAQVIVEELQRIGIDASMSLLAGGAWNDNAAFGDFESHMAWVACGSVNEPWASMDFFNTSWLMPIGERANFNYGRWSGDNAEAYSALVNQIGSLPLGDPLIEELVVEAFEYWLQDLPLIPTVQARKLVPFNTTYWTNWPTSENNYNHPANWWMSVHQMLHEIEPVQ